MQHVQYCLNEPNAIPSPAMNPTTPTHDPVRDFVEKLGLCGEEDGLPRIAGRLIGFLMMQERAHSLEELAETLQVSKGSVSTNARLLEDRGILVRAGAPGDRRDYYEIAPAHFERFIQTARRKCQRFLDLVEETLLVVPVEERVPRRRLREARLFYQVMLASLAEYQERWREVLRQSEQDGLLDEPAEVVGSKRAPGAPSELAGKIADRG
jgi:DNA-binding transcriptional regulator GbsR (MarR family)